MGYKPINNHHHIIFLNSNILSSPNVVSIVVVSVTEGDDTVEKHPIIFQTSDVVVINKVDLADAVGADADKMVADALKLLNPDNIVDINISNTPLETIISSIYQGTKK